MLSHAPIARQRLEEQNFCYQNLYRKESPTRRNFSECVGCIENADAITMVHCNKISKAYAIATMRQYRDRKMAFKVKITVDACFGLLVVKVDIQD